MQDATRRDSGEDSLLALAREFEKQLERLSRNAAAEQERGDTLKVSNQLLASSVGLPRFAPARDVRADAGSHGGEIDLAACDSLNQTDVPAEQLRGDGVKSGNDLLLSSAGLPKSAPVRDFEANAGLHRVDTGGAVGESVKQTNTPTEQDQIDTVKLSSKSLASGVDLSKSMPARDVEANDDHRRGHSGSAMGRSVKQAVPYLPDVRRPEASCDVTREPPTTVVPFPDESTLSKPLLSGVRGNPRCSTLRSGLQFARAQSLARAGTVERSWLGQRKDMEYMEQDLDERPPVKYLDSFKTFYHNIAIALRVAFWCTVFGMPIYCQAGFDLLFGSTRCQASQFGRYVEASDGSLIPFTESMRSSWSQVDDVWCGCLPKTFLAYWPNVIQMIVYTVYQTSGTTIMFAWEGFLGTLLAILNVYLMMAIWPSGAMEPGYIEWIVWIDCLGVIFVFLISQCATSTIKFGMSWHVCLMMSFMNPNTGPQTGTIPTGIPGVAWDSEATVVLLTTVAGLVLAVLSTYLPYPMLNVTRIDDDAQNVINAIEHIWADAVQYFCGDVRKAKRFQIEAKIIQLSGTIAKIKGNLEASWWETLDLFRYRSKRKLYAALDQEFDQINQVLYTMKGCILEAQFDQDHLGFMDKRMHDSCWSLMTAAVQILHDGAHFCEDGVIDDDERDFLLRGVEHIKRYQVSLLQLYDEKLTAGTEGADINGAVSNCTIFIYSLSVFAWRVSEFAEHHLASRKAFKRESWLRRLCGPVMDTWHDIVEIEHRNFAVRNVVSISLCYVLGFFLDGSMFRGGYNSQMANTLTLLISRYAGTSFDVNMKRLIGVSLGKVLPLLIMAVVNLFPCFSSARMVVHAASIFIYIFLFEYMYFTSPQWSYVGVCAAAFGTTFLFAPCVKKQDFSDQFADRYEEIGQVIFAMVIQIFVDFALKSRNTRQIAIEHTTELGKIIQMGFQHFFDGGNDCANCLKLMKAQLSPADEFRPMTNPNLSVVPGPKTPFKHDLYENAIEGMKLIVSDFEMICMCSMKVKNDERTFNNHDSLLEFLSSFQAMQDLQLDFMSLIGLTRRALDILLHHDTEDVVRDVELAELEAFSGLVDLHDVPRLMEEVKDAAGQAFARLDSATIPRKESFTISPCERGEAGLHVSEQLSILDVKPSFAAESAGMSASHKGWIITHVDGQEVTPANAQETWSATQTPGRSFTIDASVPLALWSEPRVRLLVTIKALRNARLHMGSIAASCVQRNIH